MKEFGAADIHVEARDSVSESQGGIPFETRGLRNRMNVMRRRSQGDLMNRPRQSEPLFPEVETGPGADAVGSLTTKSAQELRRALQRVHAGFIAFALLCIAAMGLGYPRLGDGQRVDALTDLAKLSSEVQVAGLRGQVAKTAERELAFDLEQVARAVALPELTAQTGLGPQVQLQVAEAPALATLGEQARVAQSGASFQVRGPDLEALAASLRWRLARQREPRQFVLTDLRLAHTVDREAVDVEASVEPARVEALKATAAYDQAYDHYTALKDSCEELAKRGLSKKKMLPHVQERVAAYEVVTENKAWMRRANRTYSDRATRALRPRNAASSEHGSEKLVIATLQSEGSKPWRVEIAMTQGARTALAPPFGRSAALTRLQRNPLWSEIRGLNAANATQQLEQQLSFHAREKPLAAVPVSGIGWLHALPLLLLGFVWMLNRSCRAATRAYDPFGSNQGTTLPTPGTGNRALDHALLLSLPLTVCCLVCVSLWRVHAEPWLAVGLSLPLLAQSVIAVRRWKEQHRLLEIARNRSLVQPLPERVSAPVGRSRLTEV